MNNKNITVGDLMDITLKRSLVEIYDEERPEGEKEYTIHYHGSAEEVPEDLKSKLIKRVFTIDSFPGMYISV